MDAIKNKMKSLKSETENALTKANQLDTEAKEANPLAGYFDRNVMMQKRKEVLKSMWRILWSRWDYYVPLGNSIQML